MPFSKTADAPIIRIVKEDEVEDLARETERRRLARLQELNARSEENTAAIQEGFKTWHSSK